jgi:hypothetical protein
MTKQEAIEELELNINTNFTHAVLLCNNGEYRTELHTCHAGNCCCDQHEDFVWREESPWTDPDELEGI